MKIFVGFRSSFRTQIEKFETENTALKLEVEELKKRLAKACSTKIWFWILKIFGKI